MSKDRILGSSVKLQLTKNDGSQLEIEVDSFSKSQKHEIKARQPLGQVGEHHQVIYKGWEMEFKLGKVDAGVAGFFAEIDTDLLAGRVAPRVKVVETIQHYDGSSEVWIYPDTVLYGYKGDAGNASDEIKEEFKGACNKRERG